MYLDEYLEYKENMYTKIKLNCMLIKQFWGEPNYEIFIFLMTYGKERLAMSRHISSCHNWDGGERGTTEITKSRPRMLPNILQCRMSLPPNKDLFGSNINNVMNTDIQ